MFILLFYHLVLNNLPFLFTLYTISFVFMFLGEIIIFWIRLNNIHTQTQFMIDTAFQLHDTV